MANVLLADCFTVHSGLFEGKSTTYMFIALLCHESMFENMVYIKIIVEFAMGLVMMSIRLCR